MLSYKNYLIQEGLFGFFGKKKKPIPKVLKQKTKNKIKDPHDFLQKISAEHDADLAPKQPKLKKDGTPSKKRGRKSVLDKWREYELPAMNDLDSVQNKYLKSYPKSTLFTKKDEKKS